MAEDRVPTIGFWIANNAKPATSDTHSKVQRFHGERSMTRVAVLLLPLSAQSALAQTTFHGNVARTGVYESPGPKQLNGVK